MDSSLHAMHGYAAHMEQANGFAIIRVSIHRGRKAKMECGIPTSEPVRKSYQGERIVRVQCFLSKTRGYRGFRL